MMRPTRDHIAALRREIARLERDSGDGTRPRAGFALGAAGLDAFLKGGLARARVHEVFAAATGDVGAAAGFAAGLALRAAGRRPLLWARDAHAENEDGVLSAPGLLAWGLDPDRLILVRARDAGGVLRAGEEAARGSALGAALMEIRGAPRALDLTASRRLALAARASGATLILLRTGAGPAPSAAQTRWVVRAAASRPLEAGAPGRPAFDIVLLRWRAGTPGRAWRVEWNRDGCSFTEPAALSRPVAGVPADRPAGAATKGYRRAG